MIFPALLIPMCPSVTFSGHLEDLEGAGITKGSRRGGARRSNLIKLPGQGKYQLPMQTDKH